MPARIQVAIKAGLFFGPCREEHLWGQTCWICWFRAFKKVL